jgi:GNAT superfamily N-acetyltransferase
VSIDGSPVGRGMVLFPGHEEYSISALRERCAEGRDVFVRPERRRTGVARSIMTFLEAAARERGLPIGLSVSVSEGAAPARALYASLGYRQAHGPYVTSTNLDGDDGPIAVFAVLVYLLKPQ